LNNLSGARLKVALSLISSNNLTESARPVRVAIPENQTNYLYPSIRLKTMSGPADTDMFLSKTRQNSRLAGFVFFGWKEDSRNRKTIWKLVIHSHSLSLHLSSNSHSIVIQWSFSYHSIVLILPIKQFI